MSIRMAIRKYRLALLILLVVSALGWVLSPALEAAVTESAPVPATQIPQSITDAINSPDRPAADKALDAGRKPDQIVPWRSMGSSRG